ncbi:MAG: cation-transporting P-type ATPase, partial [Candidatus Caldarchaeum sp.]|nr:cation-transporting P-type ATPase [Candidatus Caldarchaeum sp.]
MLAADVEKSWHASTVEEAVARLGTDPVKGLTSEEARKRLQQYGFNELEKAPKPSAL